MDEWMNYEQFDRQTWHGFFPTDSVRLTQGNLDEIKSLNDRISIADVQDVYLPLIKLIQLRYQNFWNGRCKRQIFYSVPRCAFHILLGLRVRLQLGRAPLLG